MDKKIAARTEKIFAKYPQVTFDKGVFVIEPGQRPRTIYFLKSGLVKQFVVNGSQKKIVLHQFRPGSFFDLRWLVSNQANRAYYQAVTNSKTFVVPLKDVNQLLRQDPELLFYTTKRLLLGLEGLTSRLEILATYEVYPRVAELLVYLSAKHGQKNQNQTLVIPFPLTHQDIASWVAATRETVSLAVEKLQKLGLIDHQKRLIRIKNLPGLVREAKTGEK